MTDEKFNNNYDVFRAYLVENAEYAGRLELPCLSTSDMLPNELITFSKAMSKSAHNYDKTY